MGAGADRGLNMSRYVSDSVASFVWSACCREPAFLTGTQTVNGHGHVEFALLLLSVLRLLNLLRARVGKGFGLRFKAPAPMPRNTAGVAECVWG